MGLLSAVTNQSRAKVIKPLTRIGPLVPNRWIFSFFSSSKSNSMLYIERAKRETEKDAVWKKEKCEKNRPRQLNYEMNIFAIRGVWNESSKLPIYYIHWAIICGWLNCRKKRKLSISTWSFALGLFHCVFFFIIIAILFMRNKAIGIESRNRFM